MRDLALRNRADHPSELVREHVRRSAGRMDGLDKALSMQAQESRRLEDGGFFGRQECAVR